MTATREWAFTPGPHDSPRERVTWAEAGGEAPSLVSIDPFNIFTEADPVLGAGAVLDNSWVEREGECSGHLRIKFGSSGVNAGEGIYSPRGWPRVPKVTADTGDYARSIGQGVVIDSSAGSRPTPIQLFLDPAVSPYPFYFVPGIWTDIIIDAGTVAVLMPNPFPIVQHNNPIAFAAGDVINITFAFEGA